MNSLILNKPNSSNRPINVKELYRPISQHKYISKRYIFTPKSFLHIHSRSESPNIIKKPNKLYYKQFNSGFMIQMLASPVPLLVNKNSEVYNFKNLSISKRSNSSVSRKDCAHLDSVHNKNMVSSLQAQKINIKTGVLKKKKEHKFRVPARICRKDIIESKLENLSGW